MAQQDISDGMKAYASTITGPAGRPPSKRRAKHQAAEKQIADFNQFMGNHLNALANRLNTIAGVINQLKEVSPEDGEHQRLETLAMLQTAVDAFTLTEEQEAVKAKAEKNQKAKDDSLAKARAAKAKKKAAAKKEKEGTPADDSGTEPQDA